MNASSEELFRTTHWTVVLTAGNRDTLESHAAMEKLCSTYWYPLYAYVRRRGYSKEDAEDLTQAFFAGFFSRNYLDGLSAERGRFRAFLLASLKHFLSNEWDRTQRQKRGGAILHLSLDWQSADTQFQIAAEGVPSPDSAFDREWALALLETVIDRLAKECTAADRGRVFEALKPFLTADKSGTPQSATAEALGLSEGAMRVALHRLRKRYRELLRDEVAQTLASPAHIDEEMGALITALVR